MKVKAIKNLGHIKKGDLFDLKIIHHKKGDIINPEMATRIPVLDEHGKPIVESIQKYGCRYENHYKYEDFIMSPEIKSDGTEYKNYNLIDKDGNVFDSGSMYPYHLKDYFEKI